LELEWGFGTEAKHIGTLRNNPAKSLIESSVAAVMIPSIGIIFRTKICLLRITVTSGSIVSSCVRDLLERAAITIEHLKPDLAACPGRI
jgi:hypothetical protein